MSCNWPWKSLIISHYSLTGIIWSSPSFLLLKIEWTHTELFNAHCNMFPFCHSFTSFIHSLHSFIHSTRVYWMPVLCQGLCWTLGTQRWPGQSPVLPSELTLPWADLIYQASNHRVSSPSHKQRCIYSHPWCHSPAHLSALSGSAPNHTQPERLLGTAERVAVMGQAGRCGVNYSPTLSLISSL